MLDAYIYDGLRTPFGRHAGALASVRPDDLVGDLTAKLLARRPFDGRDVEDVVLGCTNRAGEDSRKVARDLGIGREESDALASQRRYAAAKAAGFFDGEIAPVEVPGHRKGGVRRVEEDEHPRPGTTPEALAKLRAGFEGGIVTAGNASGINDGAAALLVGSRAAGERAGTDPLARVLPAAAAGVEPRVMGLGPVPASRKALERVGLGLAETDVTEINGAFAAQVLGCLKLM